MLNGPSPGVLLYGASWALLIAVCVAALIRAMWAPLELYRRPCCGGCGHAVSDFFQGRCPECGGLYAKVGISTPSMAGRLRGSLVLALLAWTALCMLGVGYVYRLLEQRANDAYQVAYAAATAPPPPQTRMSEQSSWEYAPGTWVSQGSITEEERAAANYRVSIRTDLITDKGKIESGTGTMEVRPNGQSGGSELAVAFGKGSYELKDAAGKEIAKGDAVSEDVIRRLYGAAGLDTENAVVRRGMEDSLKLAGFIKNDPGAFRATYSQPESGVVGRLRAIGGGGGGKNWLPNPTPTKPPPARPNGPTPGDMMIAGPIVLAVYAAGCWFIAWRHRRLVRGGSVPRDLATPAPPAPTP
jgi:hypothetical protein